MSLMTNALLHLIASVHSNIKRRSALAPAVSDIGSSKYARDGNNQYNFSQSDWFMKAQQAKKRPPAELPAWKAYKPIFFSIFLNHSTALNSRLP